MADDPIMISDVEPGDFAAKGADKFAAKDETGADKIDDGKASKEEPKQKLTSDYAIKDKDKEAARSGKLELGYDLPREEEAAAIEAEKKTADEKREAEEAKQQKDDQTNYVASVLDVLGSTEKGEDKDQSPTKRIESSLKKAEETWSRIPQEETGDPEKPNSIPEGALESEEVTKAIKEAEEELSEARKQIGEVQQALGKLSEIKACAGDALAEITEGMSELEGKLSELSKICSELSAQISAAKLGYPHNIAALLAQARNLGSAASTTAEDVKAEAEKAYTELKNEIYASYQEEYGEKAVRDASFLFSENPGLGQVDRDVESFDKPLRDALRRQDLKFVKKPEVQEVIEGARRVPQAQQVAIANDNDDLLAQARKKEILTQEQHDRLREYSQKGLIDKAHYDQLRAAIESGDKARIEAARTLIEQAIEHKGDQHRHFTGLHMDIDSWPPEEKEAWLNSDRFKQWSAKDGKGAPVSEQDYQAIIAKGKDGKELTHEERATIRVYKAQQAGATVTGLAAIVSYGKTASKELSPAQQADIDRAWTQVYNAPEEHRLDALKNVLARQANYGVISAKQYDEAIQRFNSEQEGAALRALVADLSSAEAVERLRAGGNDYMNQAIDRATNARYNEDAIKKHAKATLEMNKTQYRRMQRTADALITTPEFKDLKELMVASGGMIPDGVQSALTFYAAEVENTESSQPPSEGQLTYLKQAETLLHESIAASRKEAEATGLMVKDRALAGYKLVHPDRYDALVAHFKKHQGLDITKPEDVAKIDLTTIKGLNASEYAAHNGVLGQRRDPNKPMSADYQKALTAIALAEFRAFTQASVIIREASKAVAYDQAIGGGYVHKEFMAIPDMEGRLDYLQNQLGMIDKNNPVQRQIGKNILEAFKGKDNELIEALVGLQSSDQTVKDKYRAVFNTAMLEKGKEGVTRLLQTDLDIVLHRARTAAQAAADKAAMEHYERVIPSTGMAIVHRNELSRQTDDAIINPAADADQAGREIYESTYNQVYLSQLLEAASRDEKLRKELAPIFQDVSNPGEAHADASGPEATSRAVNLDAAVDRARARARSKNDTQHIGFMSGNRKIHEAIELVAKGKSIDLSERAVELINDLKEYSGDSIQRMRFIEELRAEMKQPAISPEELEMLVEGLKGADTLAKISQSMDRLSTPQGVDQAQQKSQASQQDKKDDATSSGATSTQSSGGGNSDRAAAIVADIRNAKPEDLCKYVHSTSATVQAAVSAAMATAEYKRIDREAVIELGRAATLDPTRSPLSNVAALNHMLNHSAIISQEAYQQLKQSGQPLNADQTRQVAAVEMRNLATTALCVAAQIQAQIDQQVQAARTGPNVATTQAATRSETLVTQRTEAVMLQLERDGKLQAVGADPRSRESQVAIGSAMQRAERTAQVQDGPQAARQVQAEAGKDAAVRTQEAAKRDQGRAKEPAVATKQQESSAPAQLAQATAAKEKAATEAAASARQEEARRSQAASAGPKDGKPVAPAKDTPPTPAQVAEANRPRPAATPPAAEAGGAGKIARTEIPGSKQAAPAASGAVQTANGGGDRMTPDQVAAINARRAAEAGAQTPRTDGAKVQTDKTPPRDPQVAAAQPPRIVPPVKTDSPALQQHWDRQDGRGAIRDKAPQQPGDRVAVVPAPDAPFQFQHQGAGAQRGGPRVAPEPVTGQNAERQRKADLEASADINATIKRPQAPPAARIGAGAAPGATHIAEIQFKAPIMGANNNTPGQPGRDVHGNRPREAVQMPPSEPPAASRPPGGILGALASDSARQAAAAVKENCPDLPCAEVPKEAAALPKVASATPSAAPGPSRGGNSVG